MKGKKRMFWLGCVLSILLLTACGSNSGSGGDQTANPAGDLGSDVESGIKYVGAATCVGCHADFSWSDEEVDNFLAGPHVIHSGHIAANSSESCLECHDPLGDGPTLEALIDAVNVPAGGLAAVTCENCHGAGGDHHGIGPMPTPQPGVEACTQCHNNQIPEDHGTNHPEAMNIAAEFASSAHATSLASHMFVDGSSVKARCAKCHADQGAKLYKNTKGDYKQLHDTLLPDGTPPVQDATPIQCRTCHDAHNPSKLLLESTATASAEFRTCTSCHQVSGSYHGADNSHSWNEAGEFTAADRIITDTHFDDASTPEVEGYNIDPTNERACRDCHNVHSGELTINEQWATSGHAGEISDVKAAADASDLANIIAAAVTSAEGGAFVEDDFAHEGWTGDCQRCHTSTGSRNYLSDPVNYDPANNDFSYLAVGQREMIYCWACHTDNGGGVNNPGVVTTVGLTYPDFANSNLCIGCHAGDGKGADVVDDFVSTHMLTAAGVLTSQNCYEFAGLDYADKPYFEHTLIGLTVAEDGSVSGSGPCAGCHMQSDEEHSFKVVEKDESGAIVALKSTICADCHYGEHGPGMVTEDTTTKYGLQTVAAGVAFLEAEAEGYRQALEILLKAIEDQGIEYLGHHPYFEGINWTDPDGDGTHQFDAEMAAGAASNYYTLAHEPGGYAHNRFYVKRLIFDSIDYIVDGAIDGTITLDAVTYPEAAHWLGADGAGVIAERP